MINVTKNIMFLLKNNKGKGRIITISISKIKKIMAIKKNFKEKGIRDRENGSNPHSKGDNFSLFATLLKEIIKKIIKIIKEIKIITVNLIV